MKKLNTKGFSPLHILLLVVIVGLIGGVGYYVYNSQKKTNTALDNAAKSQGEPQKSEKKEEDKKTNTEKANSSTGYLVVEEWGVKIKTSSPADDVYYKSSDASPTMIIYSKSADALRSTGGTSCKGEYIAYLTRYKVSDDKQNDPINTGSFTKVKEINGYNYWVSTDKQYQPNCFVAGDGQTPDLSVSDKFTSIAQKFVTDSSTIAASQ